MSAAALFESFSSVVEPPPNRTAWQWADENRILPRGSAQPGPWRSSKTPYMIEPYEMASDPICESLVLVMGAQMSKTEFELNILGHRFDDGPYVPALYVGPTQTQVSSISRDRFQEMLDSSPSLNSKLAKGQQDKITEKFIGGIRLGFAWAGSPTEISSHPAGLCVVDEVDRMVEDVGNEGDPIELIRARQMTYSNKLMVVASTPTVTDASAIMSLFDEGTKKIWYWPCQHCGKFFRPRHELLSYPESEDYGEVREGARVHCSECGAGHEDVQRDELNANGKYFAHRKDPHEGYLPIEKEPENATKSYWASGLCSPFAKFGERAERLLKAKLTNNQNKIQAVINVNFGEPFKVTGEAPEREELLELITDAPRGVIPMDARLLTAGCDVQSDGIYYVIRAWSFNDHSHLVENGFIHGDPSYDDVWIIWQQLMTQKYDRDMEIIRGFVDSGYNPQTDKYRRPAHKVYHATWRTMGRMMPSKGWATRERPLDTKKMDLNVEGRVLSTARSVTLWHINTDHFKTWIRSQINPPEGADIKFTLHRDVEDEYIDQMMAEELIVTDKGRKWITPGKKDNHYFDCEVLARAAATSLKADRINAPTLSPGATPTQAPPATRAPQDPRLNHRGGRFARRG